MAAYAAIVSLMNTIDNFQNHRSFSTSLDKYQIETLCEKLVSLLDFVENYNFRGGISKDEVEDLESQIASAAHAAEDVIEYHIVNHILPGFPEEGPSFLFDLQQVIQGVDSVNEKIRTVKEVKGLKDKQQPNSAMPAASSRLQTTGRTSMTGFDSYLVQLQDWLTGQQSNRQIIPITGMGGIGKTTLARNVYESSLIVQHFDVCAWVTVSQAYYVREILAETLSCLGANISGEETNGQLSEKLHKKLFGRRYLIILDDVWSIEAWSEIQNFLPDNGNGSRIIVTTRLSDVTNHFGPMKLDVDFLNDDESWSLFCEKAFGQEDCPSELEEIGKKIVKKCKGLPLSIVVIAGLLGKSTEAQLWENVEQDISLFLNSGEENQCSNILLLSYIHLPACLKPCFIYMGIFPEDHEIRVPRLIKLWVAEGFIKQNKEQSFEEVAEGYIKDLIGRNLLLVCRLRSNGKCKSLKIHDLLRDLCLRIAEKEKFFFYMRDVESAEDVDRGRCIVTDESYKEKDPPRVFCTSKSARSILCHGDQVFFSSRLLRVLFVIYSRSKYCSLHQVNLRFYASKYISVDMLFLEIPQYWNLQTLIIRNQSRDAMRAVTSELLAPSKIWEMRYLRHLEIDWIGLPDPPLSGENDDVCLRNLQTLMIIYNFKCSEEVCKRIPNIRNLHIRYDEERVEDEITSHCCLDNVGRLNKLESLSYYFLEEPSRDAFLRNLALPSSLKKLVIDDCGLEWNDLTIIGLLPRLEVLKLSLVGGSEWDPVEEEFIRLKYLQLSGGDLVKWNADKFHFPVLENLVLRYLQKLEEIPLDVGEISTLQCISLDNCSISSAISALEILEEQESLGNEGLRVRVNFFSKTGLHEFKEKVGVERITTNNFLLTSGH